MTFLWEYYIESFILFIIQCGSHNHLPWIICGWNVVVLGIWWDGLYGHQNSDLVRNYSTFSDCGYMILNLSLKSFILELLTPIVPGHAMFDHVGLKLAGHQTTRPIYLDLSKIISDSGVIM